MVRSIGILSINFPFRNPDVTCDTELASSRALFDFDVVVIRPSALPAKAADLWSKFSSLEGMFQTKRTEIFRLLRVGGVLVVVLDAVSVIQYDSGRSSYMGGTVYTVSNYHFLDDYLFQTIANGTGSRIQATDATEPFAKVIQKSTVEWTAYFKGRSSVQPWKDLRVFATNGAGAYVGAVANFGPGRVVFLPNFKQLNEEGFINACREYRFAREGTVPPSWLDFHLASR